MAPRPTRAETPHSGCVPEVFDPPWEEFDEFDAGLLRGTGCPPSGPHPPREFASPFGDRTFLDPLPVVTFVVPLAGNTGAWYVSPQIEALLGFTAREWVADPNLWHQQLHPADRERWRDEFPAALHPGATFSTEYRFLARDGRVVWVHGEAAVVADEQGRPLWLRGVAVDVTNHRRGEGKALRDSEALYRSLVTPLPAGVYRKDLRGRLVFVNERFCELAAKPAQELIGRTVFDLLPRDAAELAAADDARVAATRGVLDRIETHPTGDAPRTVRVIKSPVLDGAGEVVGTQGLLWDVSQGVRTQLQLHQSRDRSKHLARQLLEAQENERRQLARELHDEVGQTLTAMKLRLLRLSPQPAAGTKEESGDLLAMVDHLLDQVRAVSLDLRPPMLDDLGLLPTLRWLLERKVEANGLAFQLHSTFPPDTAPRGLQTVCFRIVQEAVTNVLRHARACVVEVRVDQTDHEIELMVRDDGTGFDLDAAQRNAAAGRSMGLLGMQERANLAGGELTIHTAPNEGTTVRVRLPLSPRTHLERRHRRRERP